jgi:hypothetical protein
MKAALILLDDCIVTLLLKVNDPVCVNLAAAAAAAVPPLDITEPRGEADLIKVTKALIVVSCERASERAGGHTVCTEPPTNGPRTKRVRGGPNNPPKLTLV